MSMGSSEVAESRRCCDTPCRTPSTTTVTRCTRTPLATATSKAGVRSSSPETITTLSGGSAAYTASMTSATSRVSTRFCSRRWSSRMVVRPSRNLTLGWLSQCSQPRGFDPFGRVDGVVPAQLHAVLVEWHRIGQSGGAQPADDGGTDQGGDPSGVEDGRREPRPVVLGKGGQQVRGVDEDDRVGGWRGRLGDGRLCVHGFQVCGPSLSAGRLSLLAAGSAGAAHPTDMSSPSGRVTDLQEFRSRKRQPAGSRAGGRFAPRPAPRPARSSPPPPVTRTRGVSQSSVRRHQARR